MHVQRRTVSKKDIECAGAGKGNQKTQQIIMPRNIEHTPERFPITTPTMTNIPNDVIDTPSRLHYAASNTDILRFDEIAGASPDTFEPENRWMQVSVDVSNEQYDTIHLHHWQGSAISSNSSQRDSGTFIDSEQWGGSYMMMKDSDLDWATQMEHARFPEYHPHLHYSRESLLHGALGDYIYNPLLYM